MTACQTSLIVAFYNNINYLKLVLAGFSRQSDKDFELIIADDGSRADVVEEIRKISGAYPFTIRHLWHDDQGWRKNVILNKAVMAAASDYLVFIDADCIPHRHFVHEHRRNRERRTILSGRRMNLSADITERLTPKAVQDGFLEKRTISWLLQGLHGDVTHAEKSLYLPVLSYFLKKKNRGLLGCNFSMYRDDLISINGFDERYLAPTVGEDTEIEHRAGLSGMKLKSVRNLAIQYHLHHQKLSRKNDNQVLFEETIAMGYFWTPHGISKETSGSHSP